MDEKILEALTNVEKKYANHEKFDEYLKDDIEPLKVEINFYYLKRIGYHLVEIFKDEELSKKAEESFNNITINKNIPDAIPEVNISAGEVHLPTFLTENNLTKSNSEARRLIASGAFKIDDIKFLELDIKSEKLLGKTLQIGKRKFLRINNK